MIYVLDACAMIAFLRNEIGADVVEGYLQDAAIECFAHSINLCEVYYDFCRAGGENTALEALGDLKAEGVTERSDFDTEFWQEAGRYKADRRKVSLADCFALTLAKRLNGILLTSDHHELDPVAAEGIYQVEFIR